MQVIHAAQALLSQGWAREVRVEIDDGRIAQVTPGAAPDGQRVGVLIPAPVNVHSHAFQRAMAGLAERRGPSRDSFWTWRELMYRFLERLTPEQVEAIAGFVQMEMLEAGFGASVEFHYLHHAPGGTPYDDPAEMCARIAAAAEASGAGLTLLPVLYRFGGCDGRPLDGGQRRFGNDPQGFARLMEGAAKAVAELPGDAVLGVAPHSLRAVAPRDLGLCATLAGEGPVHMHLAEQAAEVAEVEAALGARPVRWVLDNAAPSPRWCFVHCTQMTLDETEGLARTGAVAGLCPLTEASLGDGTFDGVRWTGAGGAFAVGSDSNIRISLSGELRQLETSQRLRDRSRAVLATPDRSTGRRLMEDVARGGAQAAGRAAGAVAPGLWADLLALDATHPDLAGLDGNTALDTFIMAGGREMVAEVWSAGRHVVTAGRHIRREAIEGRYVEAVQGLRGAL